MTGFETVEATVCGWDTNGTTAVCTLGYDFGISLACLRGYRALNHVKGVRSPETYFRTHNTVQKRMNSENTYQSYGEKSCCHSIS